VVASVDSTRVAQIVANLLNNASKHSPPGGQVRVRLRRQGDRAVIDIVDEGAGIPPDQLARVFGMFTKIERSFGGGSNDGLGIGLALSRQLAELHGGTLTANSAGEGRGATFTLSLPLGIEESATGRPMPDRCGPASGTAPTNVSLRIVVVEDNADSAEMMSVWLEELGHHVKVARTGPDGVGLILDTQPDVVLCDIGLPGMDGLDVCRRVVGAMQRPPVMIALTGWGSDADRHGTVQAGFRHHLVKPVEPDALQGVLESIRSRESRPCFEGTSLSRR
jgi:CheY-like chemotaxis protein